MNVKKSSDGAVEYVTYSTASPRAKAVEALRADMDSLLKEFSSPSLADGEGVVKPHKGVAVPHIGGHGHGYTLTVMRKED